MNIKRDPWPSLLRWDRAVYLIVVGALLLTLAMQVPAAFAADGIRVSDGDWEAAAAAQVMSRAGFDLGALYALLLWIVMPLLAFVIVNVGASRRFRRRIAEARGGGAVPIVRVKVRAADVGPAARR